MRCDPQSKPRKKHDYNNNDDHAPDDIRVNDDTEFQTSSLSSKTKFLLPHRLPHSNRWPASTESRPAPKHCFFCLPKRHCSPGAPDSQQKTRLLVFFWRQGHRWTVEQQARTSRPHHKKHHTTDPTTTCMSPTLSDVFGELGILQYLDVFVDQGFDTWETILDITESDL